MHWFVCTPNIVTMSREIKMLETENGALKRHNQRLEVLVDGFCALRVNQREAP